MYAIQTSCDDLSLLLSTGEYAYGRPFTGSPTLSTMTSNSSPSLTSSMPESERTSCTLAYTLATEFPTHFSIQSFTHTSTLPFTDSLIFVPIPTFSHTFIHPYLRSPVPSFPHTLIHPYPHSPIPSFTRTFVLPYPHSPVPSFSRTFVLPYCHSPVSSFSRNLVLPYHHSPIPSFSHTTGETARLTITTPMFRIAKMLCSTTSGLEVKDRIWLKMTIPKSFIGQYNN